MDELDFITEGANRKEEFLIKLKQFLKDNNATMEAEYHTSKWDGGDIEPYINVQLMEGDFKKPIIIELEYLIKG